MDSIAKTRDAGCRPYMAVSAKAKPSCLTAVVQRVQALWCCTAKGSVMGHAALPFNTHPLS